MKFKLLLFSAFTFLFFSCKNEPKENVSKQKPLEQQTKNVVNDSVKSDSGTVSSKSKNPDLDKKLLSDFFTKNDKKPQFFTINNAKDTTIVCAENTKITIRANSFALVKSRKEVSGKITIAVKEYYSVSDIILGRLSTTSNGKLLETGGMLHITATSDNEKCDLGNGKAIEIEFPRKKEKTGMQLFTGNWKNDQINWNVDQESVDLNQTFTKVDQKPEYPGGFQKMYKFIGKNYRTQEDGKSGRIYASFTIDKEGNVTNVKITKGLSKEADDEFVRVIKMLPKFTPGKINGLAVNTTYSLPITIQSPEEYGSSSRSSRSATTYNPRAANYTENAIQEASAAEISSYFFSSSKLGYINCDRFLNFPDDKIIDYAINLNDETDACIYVLFHRYKSIIRGNQTKENVVFKNIASNEKITIVAVKYFDSKPFLAVKETITGRNPENDLAFQPVTLEGIKGEMKKLNRLN